MIEVRQTSNYEHWFAALRDKATRARIDVRIRRVALGNLGDIKSVGDGVFELRIHYGPGYRIYLTWLGNEVVVLLAGGNKSSQIQDILLAKKLAAQL